MPEDGGREHDDHKRAQASERHSEGFTHLAEGLESPTIVPSSPPALSDSLLGDPRLKGRGNAPVNAAVMRQMQRVYGNQATTRFLQARREGESVGQTLPPARPTQSGQPPAVNRAVQRFVQAHSQRQLTTASAPPSSSSPIPTPTHDVTQADPTPERQATGQGDRHIQHHLAGVPSAQGVQTLQPAQRARAAPPIQRAIGQPVPVQRGLWDDAAKWALERAAKAVGGDRLWSLLQRAGAALGSIISNPGRFLGNLIAGVKGGFERFSQNIGGHLQRGLKEWLFGQLGKTNLQLPDALDAAGIFSLVMQVLGLTAGRIREKLVNMVGAREVQLIEKAWNGLQTLLSKGIGGLWAEMKEHLSDLKDVVMEEIKSWVISKVIQTAVIKILSMFNPASGLVAAIQMVWKVVQFVMERMSQLAALGQAVLDSVSAIASGNVGGVMSKIEDVLSRSLSLVIGLLANLVGLGGIGQKIRDIINKVRTKVEGALDKALKKIVEKVRSTLRRITGGSQGGGAQQGQGQGTQQQGADTRTPQQKQADLTKGLGEADKLVTDDKVSTIQVKERLPAIKSMYKMTALELVIDNKDADAETIHVHGTVNPDGNTPQRKKEKKKYLGATKVNNTSCKGSFDDPDWNWNGYPEHAVTRHPANIFLGYDTGQTIRKPTGKYVTGSQSKGAPEPVAWRERLTREKEQIKQRLLQGGKERGEAENEAKKQVEANYANQGFRGLDWPDLYLVKDWDGHHIHPVNWGGSDAKKNLQYIRKGEHYPFTTWWDRRKAEIMAELNKG